MKFYDAVGYGYTLETCPGVFEDQITERMYYGDMIRKSRNLQDSQSINPQLSVTNSISILADEYAYQNFIAIRYVKWAGVLWSISNVDVQRPRLVLTLGEVYNGPTP